MVASERFDPEHHDGATSLLHAGLTHWGKRALEHQTADGEWRGGPQELGSFYVANMCAARHRVRHLPANEAEPLFRDRAAKMTHGLHLTVMLRSDVFRAEFA